MKSKIYIVIYSITLVMTVFSPREVYSGGSPWYSPAEYYTFRVYDSNGLYNYDEYGRRQLKSTVVQNCELWQGLTSTNIPLKDIHNVVYSYSSREISRISHFMECSANDTLMQNQFIRWIVHHNDREIAECLSLAKLCEEIRMEQNDPWYYPTDNDRVSIGLKDIACRAQAYKGNRLRDRYALQVIRSLFASSQYDACINYWNGIQRFLPDGLIKQMIRPYVAGAYYRTGAVEHAMQIYAECGDIASLLFCAGKQGQSIDEIGQLELLYKYDSDSPLFPKILQERISKTEALIEGYWDKPIWNTLLGLRDFAWKVAREGKVTNRAMWYYTAAYLSDQNGDTQTALNLLAKAENAHGNSYIKESIMVLRIYLDAKTCIYDAAYEQKLFGQLRWLDNKIRNNIDNGVRQKTISDGFWGNYSYYYWNDMLRKIVFSAVVPRYIAHGNYVRAIQLANMADNNLLNIVGKQEVSYYHGQRCNDDVVALSEYRKGSKWFNAIDYSNALFALVDTIGVNHVIAYEQRLKQPRTAFDRFINARSHVNTDYFNELIGTQCLREMRYADALKYFEKIPSSFQYTLNTFKKGYLRKDPFSWHAISMTLNNTDYKYNFAREMHSLEQSINRTKEPNRKAQLQIRYAIGLENSINRCWALTQYYRGEYLWRFGYCTNMDWTKRASWKRANARSERLIKESLAMFTDRESAAYNYWLLGNNTKVMSDYPDTNIGEYVKSRCDNLKDYIDR